MIVTPQTPRGLRLVHPDPRLRGTRVKVAHPRKDYYLNLDGEGAVIVSETVFGRLLEVGLAGFVLTNEVTYPPSQIMALPHIADAMANVHTPGSEAWHDHKAKARLEHNARARRREREKLARLARVFAPEGVSPRVVERRV